MPILKKAVLSRAPTKLKWLGRIAREKIFDLLRTLRGMMISFFVSFRAFLIRNYFKSHLFALLYAIVGIPILITAFPNFPSIFHQSLAIIAILVPVFLNSVFWRSVAQENPRVYLRTLKLKFWVFIIFWILVSAFWLSLPFLWLSIFLQDTTLIIISLGAFALIVEMIAGISVLEATLSGLEFPAIFNSRIRKIVLRTNANACFTVIANGNNLEKDISNFKLGIEYIDSYVKAKFKLGLLKLQDYCNYFKLIAFSRNEEEKNRLREALNNFTHMLNDEMDLTDILMATRNIIGKPIFRFKDVADELDFDVGIRKSLSKNKELITFVVSLIAAILAAIQVAPFIMNTLKSISNPSLPKEALTLISAII